MQEWTYNEFKQMGVNFDSEKEVKDYDEKYKSIRNYDEEVKQISSLIKLNPESEIIEIGIGTGEHAIRLAKQCKKVVACDVSNQMLKLASVKAQVLGINNIEFINKGFLSIQFNKNSFDAVISQLALHHLPDFWKSVAINNISNILKQNGVFYLLDSIMSFDVSSYEGVINNIIDFAKRNMGARIAEEIIVNIRDEYPTYDWIIENLLLKNGFKVENKIKYTDIMSLFISVKLN